MPQHLEIEIEGEVIASMCTSHRDGTHYDIKWTGPDGVVLSKSNFDTGVQCQPHGLNEREEDFKNDFKHLERVISAASKTALDFQAALESYAPAEARNASSAVLIRLRTNQFDRGTISIKWEPNSCVSIELLVGVGLNRVVHSIPEKPLQFKSDVCGVSSTSVLEQALEAISRKGGEMSSWLKKTA